MNEGRHQFASLAIYRSILSLILIFSCYLVGVLELSVEIASKLLGSCTCQIESDVLIAHFFVSSCTELPSVEEGSVGEVSVQVDLFTHPGSGEHKVTVKGLELFLSSY